MKKILLVLSFVFSFSISGFGQSNSTIDFVGGGEFTFRTLRFSEEVSSLKGSNVYKIEDGYIAYRFGINYSHELIPNFYFKTGIRYTEGGFQDDYSGLTFSGQYDPVRGGFFGPSNNDPSIPKYSRRSYLFLEFPIVGRYEFKKIKFAPFLEVGISPNIYLNTRRKKAYLSRSDLSNIVEYEEERIGIKTLQLVASVSFGYNYHLNERFTIYGQAITRYHLTPLADTLVKYNLYNIGLELGVRKNLGI